MSTAPYFIAFLLTFFSILILRLVAFKVNLLDVPNDRKIHLGSVPLIGGMAMFIGVSSSILTSGTSLLKENLLFFLIGALILVLVGVIDDFKVISSNKKLFFQVLVSIIIIKGGGINIESLGAIISAENTQLGVFSILFTILAIVGVINSLNFSDGIDGMSASLSLITFLSIAFLSIGVNQNYPFIFSLIFVAAITAFLIFNLGLGAKSQYKIFMGDAGSTFLGLSIAWSLVSFSQGDSTTFSPVTALWIFAVPLIDTIFVMMKRISNGNSPFTPDREHLHHFFILKGMTDRQTLITVIIMSFTMASLGIFMHVNGVSEKLMFWLFVAISFVYYFTLRNAWKLLNAK
jgi:UDP-GlcNAc:undecaprenyl-phosphate/decaprenyl-phosphate GlcNAc-1-phosphate transferase